MQDIGASIRLEIALIGIFPDCLRQFLLRSSSPNLDFTDKTHHVELEQVQTVETINIALVTVHTDLCTKFWLSSLGTPV